MVDSKAAGESDDNSNHRKVADALFNMARSALERASTQALAGRLLDDEALLDRLADKVAQRLEARSAARGSGGVSSAYEVYLAIHQASLDSLKPMSQELWKPQA